jgi:hypothetical protein
MDENEEKERRPIITCRTISCLILILLFCPIILIFLLIFLKPPVIWDSFVSFSNDGIEIENPDISLEESRNIVSEQLTSLGENDVIIPEEVITVLARENFPELKNVSVRVRDESMNIYWEIDSSNNPPLLASAEILKSNTGELYVSKLGTPRFTIPEFVVGAVSNAALTAMQFGEEKAERNNLLYKILDANKDLNIQNVEFTDESLIITVDINVTFYD